MTALPDYAAALSAALRVVEPLDRFETIQLNQAGGRVLAESIKADRDLPPFKRSQMDGYALRASEYSPGKPFPVAHRIAAGMSGEVRVPSGHCVAVATGAPVPVELDAVIQHEASDRGDHATPARPVRFTIDHIAPGHAIHPRGADARAGDTLINPGAIVLAQHIALAAAVGKSSIQIQAKPRAAVFTSGDEIVEGSPATSTLQPHQIRNSNGPMLAELLQRFGACAVHAQHLPDEREATVTSIRAAISQHDLIITIGGVSAGERDFFPDAFDAAGVERSLQGAAIQPGRPIVVGRAPSSGAIVIGLPGNPVSALACACLFVWPIVRRMSGLSADLPWREVVLAESVKPNPHRRAFRPAILQAHDRIVVPSWAGSGDLAHTAPTHGLAELPVQTEAVAAGSRLRFLPWP